jgi:hypothetical protein
MQSSNPLKRLTFQIQKKPIDICPLCGKTIEAQLDEHGIVSIHGNAMFYAHKDCIDKTYLVLTQIKGSIS